MWFCTNIPRIQRDSERRRPECARRVLWLVFRASDQTAADERTGIAIFFLFLLACIEDSVPSAMCARTSQIIADLTVCGVGADESSAIASVALARRDELVQASVRQASRLATASLSSFDWKVHLTVSSDRAATLREPVALLQLRVARSAPQHSDDVVIELTADDLTRLVATLGDVNSAMQKL